MNQFVLLTKKFENFKCNYCSKRCNNEQYQNGEIPFAPTTKLHCSLSRVAKICIHEWCVMERKSATNSFLKVKIYIDWGFYPRAECLAFFFFFFHIPNQYFYEPIKLMYTAGKISTWPAWKSLAQLGTHQHKCVRPWLTSNALGTRARLNGKPWCIQTYINTLRQRQGGCQFSDDIFKCIFLNETVWISIKISLTFVSKGTQWTILQHWLVWFRLWLVAGKATSHYLNLWWLVYLRIYASLGLNESMCVLLLYPPFKYRNKGKPSEAQ